MGINMSINFDRERYNNAYDRAASANVMTADNPPQWDADDIRDSAIEDVGDQMMEIILDGKDDSEVPDLQELLLESEYEDTGFIKFTESLRVVLKDFDDHNHNRGDDKVRADNLLQFLNIAHEFVEMRVTTMAEDYVDE